jgi:diaminobutyrate-2-oxoglutarate transaminase
MNVIAELESEVRNYSRTWPTVFTHATGSVLTDEHGKRYIDFFSGAGALNYGHNNERLREALLEYISSDGITHSLDMATTARIRFLEELRDQILVPRRLNYRVQFTGPTGTDAVEAALKLVRKVSNRPTVISFTNSFHGMSLGALEVSGSEHKRAGAGLPLGHTVRIPYDGFAEGVDGLGLLARMLEDGGCGLDSPGAVIIETVQGEGGVNAARTEWLKALGRLCDQYQLLLIVDDIQAGCGRTGGFFSFEDADLTPDVVCLSKSISGYGLPMAINLIRPELDVWKPGEHTGTFRGNNLAFVTAAEALREYWRDNALEHDVRTRAKHIAEALADISSSVAGHHVRARGRGFLCGLAFGHPQIAAAVSRAAFQHGLLVETSGPRGEVVKLLPPLTISTELLDAGLEILAQAVTRSCQLSAAPESGAC